ncbi:hypothetical protein VPHF86_0192 [Vibrio phage F86]
MIKPYDLVKKMQDVVNSCTTVEQLLNARKYLLRCYKYADTLEDSGAFLTVTLGAEEMDGILTNKLCELSSTRGMRAIDTGVIKLGLDIHGVIDKAPELFTLISKLPVEVHIITGIKEELDDQVPDDLEYDHWFSIHQHLEDEGVEFSYDEKGRPWCDPALWDGAKAEYCKRENITMIIDDSPNYVDTFKALDTMYLQLTNTTREDWRNV